MALVVRAALLLAFVSALACGASTPGTPGTPTYDEIVYDCDNAPAGTLTTASDESFRAILDAESGRGFETDAARAPVLLAPAAGAPLSATAPPRFELRATLAYHVPGPLAPATPTRRAWRWRQWLSPIGTAWAHCPAVTGDNFLFRMSRDGRVVYTALLSVTSFSPDPAKWQRALAGAAGRTVELTLARAFLAQGRVAEGPYVTGAPLAFTVGE